MARHRGARGPRIHIVWSVLLTVAVLAVPGAVAAWGRSTSTFTVERIVVTGAHMTVKKDVRRALEDALLGENLFAVGGDDVRRALRSQCYLADAEIDRDFPETLRVRLVEHRPALAVLAGGRWFVVSDTGHVVCEVPPEGAAGAARAAVGQSGAGEQDGSDGQSAADGEGAASGQSDADGAAAADAAAGAGSADDGHDTSAPGTLDEGPAGKREAALPRLRVAEALRPGGLVKDARVRAAVATLTGLPRGLRRRVALLEVTKSLRVTLTLRDGLVVLVGEAARLGDKVIAVRAVRAAYRARDRDPTFIDVSVPERPLGRPLLK